MNPLSENIDVVILCGGLGTRLRMIVHDRPKPMAKINHHPFLDILVEYLSRYGCKRFILCTGYKGDFVRKYYENKEYPISLLFSEEREPLGTAGAIKNAESLIQSNVFLVMNGDSFCKVTIHNFLEFHTSKESFASIALIPADISNDCGRVIISDTHQIVSFHEKVVDAVGFVNAGIYIFDKEVLSLIPAGKTYSLEYDLFPTLIQQKNMYGFVEKQQLIDIGIPERYELAQKVFRNFTYQTMRH